MWISVVCATSMTHYYTLLVKQKNCMHKQKHFVICTETWCLFLFSSIVQNQPLFSFIHNKVILKYSNIIDEASSPCALFPIHQPIPIYCRFMRSISNIPANSIILPFSGGIWYCRQRYSPCLIGNCFSSFLLDWREIFQLFPIIFHATLLQKWLFHSAIINPLWLMFSTVQLKVEYTRRWKIVYINEMRMQEKI